MAIVDHKRPTLPVPYAMEYVDRAPKQRYYDPEFFRSEADLLWMRTWQMACRLEEIPSVGDFAEYEILDQSVIVVRTEDGVKAFQNACRHRGVRVAAGYGTAKAGFVCPFHGWCYGLDGTNTAVTRQRAFTEHNLEREDISLTPVQCELWGGCAWINLDADAPPLRECIEPFATILDAWKMDSLHAEWWYACRLPVNWKLAEAAFMEQYHVLESHPQLRISGRFVPRNATDFDPRTFIEAELKYLHAMSEGMGGMVHANDVQIAEDLARDIDLPGDPAEAVATWHRTLNDAVTTWHRDRGSDVPDLNELEATKRNEPMGQCFPHFFVLPMYSSASQYRFRPVGPEETIMEIWSLTRLAEGEEHKQLPVPEVWESDDPRWPPIPAQDFSNLPKQQKGLHSKGFDFMRLSETMEGGVANFERMVDGFIAGLSYEQLLPGLKEVNVNPLERPVVDLGF